MMQSEENYELCRLLVCCLTSSDKYFIYIQDEKYMNCERFVSKIKYGDTFVA